MKNGLALSAESPPAWLLQEFTAGVGMVRGEYLQRDCEAYITEPDVGRRVTQYLVQIAKLAAPDLVWYRTSDLDASEAAVLRGVEDAFLEPVPHLGIRGIRRSLRFPDSFRHELSAFRVAQQQCPNLRLLFPFVTTMDEAEAAKRYARAAGVEGNLGLMAETPAAVLTLPEMLDAGYSHVLVGCNDLWALTMAEIRRPGNYPTATVALGRLLELARKHTQDRDATLCFAGYLDAALIEMAEYTGVDAIVYHYAQLPALLGERYADLPDLELLAEIKQRTRAAVARLNHVT